MKNVMLAVMFCAALLIPGGAISAPDATVTGRWLATEGVAFAPWTFDFRAEGSQLTGTVSQGNRDGKGWSTGLTAPVAISDGRIDGNVINFTVLNPRANNRKIIFKGRVDNDQISFERHVEVLSGGRHGRDGIFGIDGAKQFVAKRVANQPTLSSNDSNAPPFTTPRFNWWRQRNISGTWVAQGVPNGPWTWDLQASGRHLTFGVLGGHSGPYSGEQGKSINPQSLILNSYPKGWGSFCFQEQPDE